MYLAGCFINIRSSKRRLSQLQSHQTVLYEKAELIYQQAQDWSKPIEINVSDNRLQGDYKVMADFVLSEMIQNAEARNQYLRELKAIHWDQFLNIDRLRPKTASRNMPKPSRCCSKRICSRSAISNKPYSVNKIPVARAKQLSIKSHLRNQLT